MGLTEAGKHFCELLLYDPTEGEILLDGVNIKNYRYEEYKAFFSGFKLFAYPLAQTSRAVELSQSVSMNAWISGIGNRLAAMITASKPVCIKTSTGTALNFGRGSTKIAFARSLIKDAPY